MSEIVIFIYILIIFRKVFMVLLIIKNFRSNFNQDKQDNKKNKYDSIFDN